jgi:hypothetical protein
MKSILTGFSMNRQTETWISGLIAALFLLYILVRSWMVPITIDEASTCFNHVPRRLFDILTYATDATPNNHVLNTILIKILTGIFGMNYVVVRIPALAGGALYVWAGLAIARRFDIPELRLFSLIMLCGNPFVAEFFALARGYGLSVGLMLFAVWRTMVWMEGHRRPVLTEAVVLGAVSVLANFTLLNFFVPFVGILLWHIIQQGRSQIWYLVKPVFWTTVVLALLCYQPIMQMRATDQFQFWGNNGFFEETLLPLVNSSIQNRAFEQDVIGHVFSWLIALATVGMWIANIVRWQKKRFRMDVSILPSALFAGTFAFNLAEFYLFKTPFLNPRTALFFYVLFALQLAFVAEWLWTRWQNKALFYMAPLVAFAVFNFLHCANLSRSEEWWFDSADFQVYRYLTKQYESEHRSKPYTLDTSWEMFNSMQFHLEHNHSGWAQVASLPEWHGQRDYPRDSEYYLAISEDDARPLMDQYEIVLRAHKATMVLLHRVK